MTEMDSRAQRIAEITQWRYDKDIAWLLAELAKADAALCPDRVAPIIENELRDTLGWLTRHLEQKRIYIQTEYDRYGQAKNGYGAVPIPDWDVRQRIESISKALSETAQSCDEHAAWMPLPAPPEQTEEHDKVLQSDEKLARERMIEENDD